MMAGEVETGHYFKHPVLAKKVEMANNFCYNSFQL